LDQLKVVVVDVVLDPAFGNVLDLDVLMPMLINSELCRRKPGDEKGQSMLVVQLQQHNVFVFFFVQKRIIHSEPSFLPLLS
jgi:hypothetical protein